MGNHTPVVVDQRCSIKKVLLDILQNSQESTCARASFLTSYSFIKKRLWHRCFPVNFATFLRTPFLTEHLRWLLLTVYWKISCLSSLNFHLAKELLKLLKLFSFSYFLIPMLNKNPFNLFIHHPNTKEGDKNTYCSNESRLILYSKKIFYKLTSLLDITGLWLSTSELTKLNIMNCWGTSQLSLTLI